jgi:CubicO group peptidase (beta-lactamase class C family)
MLRFQPPWFNNPANTATAPCWLNSSTNPPSTCFQSTCAPPPRTAYRATGLALIAVLSSLWLGGTCSYVQSQELPAAPVSQLEQIRKRHAIPSLIAGHFTLDGDLQLEVCGVRNVGTRQPLQSDDPMHLGSCTKSMTALLIGLLVDEGLLRWDSQLREIFSDDTQITDSPWADVTVDQLMHHVSGAVANPPWDRFNEADKPIVDQRRAVLHWMAQQPRSAESIGQFTYSNLGYMVLGHIIEQIRHHSWEDEIEQRLFAPLGITTAGFGPPSKSKNQDAPWGHVNMLGVMLATETDNVPALGPAGTVHMSMRDWAKYLRLHLHPDGLSQPTPNQPDREPPIPIRRETLQHLHTPGPQQGYAGGWTVADRPWAGGRILTHNGSNTFWYCVVFLAPEQGRGVFAASNYGLGAMQPCDEALQWLIKTYPPIQP